MPGGDDDRDRTMIASIGSADLRFVWTFTSTCRHPQIARAISQERDAEDGRLKRDRRLFIFISAFIVHPRARKSLLRVGVPRTSIGFIDERSYRWPHEVHFVGFIEIVQGSMRGSLVDSLREFRLRLRNNSRWDARANGGGQKGEKGSSADDDSVTCA